MKKILLKVINKIPFLFLLIVFYSCASKDDIVYFQNVDVAASSKSINSYNAVIKPDDMLSIVVSSLDQDLARPFNLTSVTYTEKNGAGRLQHQNYLVDPNGNIEFPVLGTLKLGGLTRAQATNLIKDLLKEYFTQPPIVNLRIENFKVTVLGEVNRPGTYNISNERITIIEALGLAGDLTIHGKRDNILVIREVDGKTTYNRVSLTSETIFNSPVYYLIQNDVIYVEPNNTKVNTSTVSPKTSENLRIIGTLVTVAALIVSITN